MGIRNYSGEFYGGGQSGNEDLTTVQMEQQHIRQLVLAFVANQPDTARLNHKPGQPTVWKKPGLSDSGRMAHFVTLPRGMNGIASPHWLIQVGDLHMTLPLGIE